MLFLNPDSSLSFSQLPAILSEVSRAVSSVSRVTKRQGCSGLKDLAKTLGPSLGQETSGRRLIRRVLFQLPGRTWEGKEELLEAAVALCAAGKGSAVTLEPFFWGSTDGSGGDRGGGGDASSSASRGVKRSRSSEPLGHTEDEEEEEEQEVGEEDEEEGEKGSNAPQEDGGSAGPGAPGMTASAGSKGSRGDGDVTSGSDDNGAADNGGGAEGSAFEYHDKLGDLDESAAAPATPPAGVSVHGQDSQQPAGSGAGVEPRKDAALEEGLASLDMEDDSPIPFGEVVTLMLSQLRR